MLQTVEDYSCAEITRAAMPTIMVRPIEILNVRAMYPWRRIRIQNWNGREVRS